uniref:Protein TsetseEP domain-containing protein n=1 Tax=Homalodisca liturata TaxID=320908 RepID=A0A1B6IQF3_9HEMI
MIFKAALFFVIVCVFQATGVLTESEDNTRVLKFKEHAINTIPFDIDAALSRLRLDSQNSFGQYLLSIKATLSKLQRCRTGSRLKLLHQGALSFGNFQACINATRNIADLETFILHVYNTTMTAAYDTEDLIKNVIQCHSAGNVFDILDCIVTAFQNSGPDVEALLSQAKGLISELEIDSENFFTNLKKCVGYTVSEFFAKASEIINKC